jgi:hypothetical protein
VPNLKKRGGDTCS